MYIQAQATYGKYITLHVFKAHAKMCRFAPEHAHVGLCILVGPPHLQICCRVRMQVCRAQSPGLMHLRYP